MQALPLCRRGLQAYRVGVSPGEQLIIRLSIRNNGAQLMDCPDDDWIVFIERVRAVETTKARISLTDVIWTEYAN